MLQKRLESLEKLAQTKPSLADACQFYGQIFQLGDTAEKFLAVKVDETIAASRQEQGFPLLCGDMLEIDAEAAVVFFRDLLHVLQKYGQQRQNELDILSTALDENTFDLEFLLRASLDRDEMSIKETAEKIGVEPALLEYCLATALSAALERCRVAGLKTEDSSWYHGYCPICGWQPSIGQLAGEEGKKFLHCGLCGNDWPFTRIACVHCGNTDHTSIAYFTAEGGDGYRVDICRKCDGYLKVVDSRERGEGVILEIEDIATLHLDELAAKEGFQKNYL